MESKGILKLLKLDSLVEHLTGYAEDKIALFKIEAKEELSVALTKAIIVLLVIIFGAFSLFFASMALAIYLNMALNSAILGFVIVALFYLIILIIGLLIKDHKALHNMVRKSVDDEADDN